jgi:hypothetical protein
MERLAVSSSNLASVGYDNTSLTLEVEFNHGGVYQYYNVTEDVYFDLLNADSIGSYFSNNIRKDYPTHKV